jgi:hypothetical protein
MRVRIVTKRTIQRKAVSLLSCAVFALTAHLAHGQDAPPPTKEQVEYSPYPGKSFPNNVYFGDTHLHTLYSTDAGMTGTTLGPEDALRFARGEEVVSNHGLPAKLIRPLDFIVIADHAENLGLAPMIESSDPVLLQNEFGKTLHDLVKAGKGFDAYDLWIPALFEAEDAIDDAQMLQTAWQRIIEFNEEFNEPGLFTALIGFEWSSSPDGNNLHRNVIFRDNKDKTEQIIPISLFDTRDPEKLWEWMAEYEEKTGGQVLAIPHNGNLSNGLMFDDVTLTTNEPIDSDYAERRMRWEPLYEVTQMKGDSEAHSLFSPDDEFADFETWDRGSFGNEDKTEEMLPREYVREAYKRGLAYESKLGVNPFKFGIIGSTDSHTGLATSREDNFFGKVSDLEPGADPLRFDEVIAGRLSPDPRKKSYAYQTSASGLAAVWARENTRESLWDSMARKEVYSTTGTRLRVRVFGGWDFTEPDLQLSDFAENGYANGVPMGGDLKAAPEGKAPRFLVRALRDVDGANLDRVQIVKGWLDKDGKTVEKVYDIAVSDGRKIGADGRSKDPVGNTVNVKEATYSNSIGAAVMQAYWQDPDFDPEQRAFYYVRVIEIPTPRWTTYDAKIFGVKLPEGVPAAIQDRAYTSPIWYTP